MPVTDIENPGGEEAELIAALSALVDYTAIPNKPDLGTAAPLNVGTSGGDVVQLDKDGKLPAVNASQLTNLPAGDYNALSNLPTLGSASAAATSDFATAAQGEKADTAVQPGDLPTLGSAAAADTSDFASAAQGATADTAVQPGDLGAVATSNNYEDLDNKPAGVGFDPSEFVFFEDFNGKRTVSIHGDGAAVDLSWVKDESTHGIVAFEDYNGGRITEQTWMGLSFSADSGGASAKLISAELFPASLGWDLRFRMLLAEDIVTGSNLLAGFSAGSGGVFTTGAYFNCQGSGLVKCRDASHNVSSGVTIAAGEVHEFRIDASNLADVKFYIDGAQVAAGTTFSRPGDDFYDFVEFMVSKVSGTSTTSVWIDWVRVAGTRKTDPTYST